MLTSSSTSFLACQKEKIGRDCGTKDCNKSKKIIPVEPQRRNKRCLNTSLQCGAARTVDPSLDRIDHILKKFKALGKA